MSRWAIALTLSGRRIEELHTKYNVCSNVCLIAKTIKIATSISSDFFFWIEVSLGAENRSYP